VDREGPPYRVAASPDDRPGGTVDHRAGGTLCAQHGRGRPELGCDWHIVNDAVIACGTALINDDPDRFGVVESLGLDEVLFVREGERYRQHFSTSIVDVGRGQLLDVVPGRTGAGPIEWLEHQGARWRDQMRFETLDLSGPYRAVFDAMVPKAT
jgi:hypothetical protein